MALFHGKGTGEREKSCTPLQTPSMTLAGLTAKADVHSMTKYVGKENLGSCF